MSAADYVSVTGLGALIVGIALVSSVGWALVVGGGICFIAGGLASAREAR